VYYSKGGANEKKSLCVPVAQRGGGGGGEWPHPAWGGGGDGGGFRTIFGEKKKKKREIFAPMKGKKLGKRVFVEAPAGKRGGESFFGTEY